MLPPSSTNLAINSFMEIDASKNEIGRYLRVLKLLYLDCADYSAAEFMIGRHVIAVLLS